MSVCCAGGTGTGGSLLTRQQISTASEPPTHAASLHAVFITIVPECLTRMIATGLVLGSGIFQGRQDVGLYFFAFSPPPAPDPPSSWKSMEILAGLVPSVSWLHVKQHG